MAKTGDGDVLLPINESARLEALHAFNILDTQRDDLLDGLTRFTAGLFNVTTALVSLVDKDRQWFKSSCGIADTEHPRKWSFCSQLVAEDLSLMIVEDTFQDKRTFNNPLVTGEASDIRFYAGAVIRSKDGYPLGTLCLVDNSPRALSATEVAQLKQLAGIVELAVQQYGQNRSLQGDLVSKAFYDPVTNLPTRTLLCERLHGLKSASRAFDKSRVTLAIINPSRFRVFNQISGRKAGDELLRAVASRLTGFVGDHQGLVARLHDDRFAVLINSEVLEASCWLRTLETALLEPFTIGDKPRRIDFSIGVAEEELAWLSSPEDLIELADIALRQNHHQPGMSTNTLTPEQRKNLARADVLENRLATAIANEELFLVYQPIVDLGNESIRGFEALVRWNLDGTLVSPGEFIPIAEDKGLIRVISHWILHTACADSRSITAQSQAFICQSISAPRSCTTATSLPA
jgi:diguanylate cyclase (GGDEF)-like protein